MTTDRRHQITVRPNGALWNEQTYRDYTGAIDRRDARPKVTRLSALNPICEPDTRPEWLKRLRTKDMTGSVA
jgi:hypothetical protein